MAKPKTTYTKPTKNATTFNRSGSSVTSWLLNSTVVTLNSTLYLLSGFTGATPAQLNNKAPITYTAQ